MVVLVKYGIGPAKPILVLNVMALVKYKLVVLQHARNVGEVVEKQIGLANHIVVEIVMAMEWCSFLIIFNM